MTENGKFALVEYRQGEAEWRVVAVVFAAAKKKPFVVYDAEGAGVPKEELEKLALEIDAGAALVEAVGRLGAAFRCGEVTDVGEPLSVAVVERVAGQWLLS